MLFNRVNKEIWLVLAGWSQWFAQGMIFNLSSLYTVESGNILFYFFSFQYVQTGINKCKQVLAT
jgi:hypothetical protein